MRCERKLGRARDFREPYAAQRHLAPVLPHAGPPSTIPLGPWERRGSGLGGGDTRAPTATTSRSHRSASEFRPIMGLVVAAVRQCNPSSTIIWHHISMSDEHQMNTTSPSAGRTMLRPKSEIKTNN